MVFRKFPLGCFAKLHLEALALEIPLEDLCMLLYSATLGCSSVVLCNAPPGCFSGKLLGYFAKLFCGCFTKFI